MNDPKQMDSAEAQAAAPAPEQELPPAVPLRPGQGSGTPGRAQPSGGECVRPYINDQLNSRLSESLRPGPWGLVWEASLDPEFPPSFVLQAGDRVVVQNTGRWELFNAANGRSIKLNKLGPSDVVMDPANGLIYLADPYGVIEAYGMRDGEAAFSMSIMGGDEWQRGFFARRGADFAVVSFERAINPHTEYPPNAVTIEVQNMGDPLQVQSEVLASARRESQFYFQAPRASAALLGPGLVVAIRNEILITEFGRKVRARYTDTFDAGPLSLDEAGRIYAIVGRGERRSLWLITTRGERVFAYDFPADMPVKLAPPAVAYDHRVFVAAGDTVACIGPEGKPMWRHPAGGGVAGMAVTASDELLVAAGSSLVVFDAGGNRRVLHDFGGDPLRTAPAVAKGGDLLVASAKKLYRLGVGGPSHAPNH